MACSTTINLDMVRMGTKRHRPDLALISPCCRQLPLFAEAALTPDYSLEVEGRLVCNKMVRDGHNELETLVSEAEREWARQMLRRHLDLRAAALRLRWGWRGPLHPAKLSTPEDCRWCGRRITPSLSCSLSDPHRAQMRRASRSRTTHQDPVWQRSLSESPPAS